MTVTEMTCAQVQETIPAFMDHGSDSLEVRRHLARCPECKAELAAYEQLRVSLSAMESATVAPPRGLMTALIQIPGQANRVEQVRTHLARNRKQYIGGAAVLAAGALGAAALRTRSRRIATA